MLGCDVLVLLSDIDGLYTADPRQDSGAAFIPEVAEITPQIEAMAGVAPAGYSPGGLVPKLSAVLIATAPAITMAIADGRRRNPPRWDEEGAPRRWSLTPHEP